MGSTVLSRRTLLAGFATFAAAGTLPRRVLGGTQPSGNPITGYQPNGFTVPPNETWEIVGTVDTPHNVIVYGTLRMRPGSTLRFVNVSESGFVGGGMEPIASDVGLWVMGEGVLDAQGTPVQGWASGAAPAGALPGSELVMTPTAVGDLRCTSFVGQSIPLVPAPDGRTFAAEVANLTRDVRIEGTPGRRSHIYIRSTVPQQIRHVAIRHMGPRRGRNEVLGRYPLHFHHCHDGVRGTVIEGVVVRDSGSHAFVPHMSNGVTFIDCVAYGVGADAYWWDVPERTDDTVFERCAAFELATPPGTSNHNLSGFLLGAGSNNAIRNCVVAANRGMKNAAGFSWPAPTTQFVWTFQNNIAHNNTNGTRVWQNGGSGTHVLEDFVGYRNTIYGVDHGAYRNDYRYERALCFGNGRAGLSMHTVGGPATTYRGCRFDGLYVNSHTVSPSVPITWTDCVFDRPVTVDERTSNPANYDFVRCGLEPSNFAIQAMHGASIYRVQRADGSAFRLRSDGVAVPIPAFA